MILHKILHFLRINTIKQKMNQFMKTYNLTYSDIIITENLSQRLYGDSSHTGETINLLELRDLLEPNMTPV